MQEQERWLSSATKQKIGKMNTHKIRHGQTTLEFSLCFIVLIILFIGGFLAFKWSMETITRRQKAFENTRSSDAINQDYYATPDMGLTVRIRH